MTKFFELLRMWAPRHQTSLSLAALWKSYFLLRRMPQGRRYKSPRAQLHLLRRVKRSERIFGLTDVLFVEDTPPAWAGRVIEVGWSFLCACRAFKSTESQ